MIRHARGEINNFFLSSSLMYRRWFSLVCGSLNLNLWRLPIKDLFNGRNHDRFANFRWRLRYFPCLKWYNLQWHLVRLRFQCFTYQFLGASISGERYSPSSISGFINKALPKLLLLLWQLNQINKKDNNRISVESDCPMILSLSGLCVASSFSFDLLNTKSLKRTRVHVPQRRWDRWVLSVVPKSLSTSSLV